MCVRSATAAAVIYKMHISPGRLSTDVCVGSVVTFPSPATHFISQALISRSQVECLFPSE